MSDGVGEEIVGVGCERERRERNQKQDIKEGNWIVD